MNADAKKRYKDIDFPFICPISNREFNSGKGLSVYVTKTLKINHEEYYCTYINHRDKSCFFCGNKGSFISISKGYRNLCEDKYCIKKSFNSHSVEGFMYRNMCSREEAEILFKSENERQLNKRLKTQSNLRKVDPLWDKKRSRNCIEFWIEKGLTKEQAEIEVKKVMNEIHDKTSKKLKENPEKYAAKYPTKLEYYISRGYSEEDAEIKISEIQNRFSLKGCIDKYGEIDGNKIFQERQKRWIETLNSKTDEEKIEINRKKITGSSYSPISQKLFWDIYNLVGNDKTKFAEMKGEFHLLNENKLWFAYDYVDTKRKKCIEFNGDFWHCNPKDFEPEQIHRIKGKKAADIWRIDEDKKNLIENLGYQVLTIWESEYKKNPKQTLEKCIKFINE
jgi:G:T-mismatch repair DNA endonuclease (very short patch repair protein)